MHPIGGAVGRDSGWRDTRLLARGLSALLVFTVLGQRFALPFGDLALPVSVLATYVAAGLLLLHGSLRFDALRTELFVAAMAACYLAAHVATWQGRPQSLSSLLLFTGIYLPWMLCVRPRHRQAFHTVATTFLRLMLVLSVVGVGQMLAQVSGVWPYTDYLAGWLQPEWLLNSYNTSNPIGYLSPIYKANAFVFLEPSFLSQFCALALLLALMLRRPAWQLMLLGAGVAASLSGTGILLLGFGLVLTALHAPTVLRPRYLAAGLLTLVVVLVSPVGSLLIARSGEVVTQGSSGYLRFVQPYTEVATGLAQDGRRYVVGAGPGTADRVLTSDRFGGAAVVYTIPAKLLFEYGVIAASFVLLFFLVSVYRGSPLPVIASALLSMVFLLSGALLQPHTAYLAWLLSSVWGEGRTSRRALATTPPPSRLPAREPAPSRRPERQPPAHPRPPAAGRGAPAPR